MAMVLASFWWIVEQDGPAAGPIKPRRVSQWLATDRGR
jgi:hypothetical protein